MQNFACTCRRGRSRCASTLQPHRTSPRSRACRTRYAGEDRSDRQHGWRRRGFQAAARTSPTSSTPGPAPPRRRTSTACSRRRNARPDSGSSTRCRRRRRRPRTPAPKSQARAGDAACTSRQSPRRRRQRRKPCPPRQDAAFEKWCRPSWCRSSPCWSLDGTLPGTTPAFSMIFFNSSFSVASHAAAAYRARIRGMSGALVSIIARRSATA